MPTGEMKHVVEKMLRKSMKEYEVWYKKWLKSEVKE